MPSRSQNLKAQFQPQAARSSSRRRVDVEEVRQRFLIVCEGAKTEPNYFQGFRVPGRVLEVEGAGRSTVSLVDEAVRLRDRRGSETYDQCWCVFDRDSFPAVDFNRAITKAASGFRVAYTNEAFELWYLLHFDDHRSALSRTQYGPILADRLGHAYKKNSESMYRELEARQEEAIHRAEQLFAEYAPQHNPQTDNPCTTVHLLVQELRKNAGP